MRPLEGLRVLDVTHVFAGPFCGFQLAVLGADVIKIEPVSEPDMTRRDGADAALNEAGMGLHFQAQACGKRALALDLKHAEGRAVFDRLLMTADIVVQNYTAQAVKALGLGYDRLAALKPDLVYCAISGFGSTGPKAEHPAYDAVIQAFSGVMANNGTPTCHPLRVGPAMIDYGTGAQAALAILAALYARAMTGRGRRIDVAMADCALMLMNSDTKAALDTGVASPPSGNSSRVLAGYGVYPTAEGSLMVGAYTSKQMAALMRVIGEEGLADEILATPRSRIGERKEKDAAALTRAFAAKTASEWEDILNRHHVPAARVRTPVEALAEPQFASRQVVQEVEGSRFAVAGFCYDEGSPAIDHPPRPHGADSRDILAELGVDEAAFDDLKARGIVC